MVHGIREEKLNETSVNFMNESCRSLPETGGLTVKNLVPRDTPLPVKGSSVPAYVIFTTGGDSYYIGFSEVYWQPVTKGYLAAHDGQTPVPICTWAHSLNCRIRGDDRAAGQTLPGWREALDNAQTLLGLIQKLALISGKAKIFGKTLCDFLGDVQESPPADLFAKREDRALEKDPPLQEGRSEPQRLCQARIFLSGKGSWNTSCPSCFTSPSPACRKRPRPRRQCVAARRRDHPRRERGTSFKKERRGTTCSDRDP